MDKVLSKMLGKVFSLVCGVWLMMASCNASAVVILQYHHVADDTPDSTSISPKQFEAHLYYLFDNEFKVWPLPKIIDHMKQGKALPDKIVAITFDDGYRNVLENATPLLNKFSFPYTIFISPKAIDQGYQDFLTWPQLKMLSKQGVTIANHGINHESAARIPEGSTEQEWLQTLKKQIETAEARLVKELDQNWQYYAYPYGEYSVEHQNMLEEMGYVAFTQQSGAFGDGADLTALPRFPVSKPYDDISALRDKLYALPFDLASEQFRVDTILDYGEKPDTQYRLNSRDFYNGGITCYVSGMGRVKPVWKDKLHFELPLDKNLTPGRRRSNCTAPSIKNPGRFYWYSRPWFVLKKDGSWFPY